MSNTLRKDKNGKTFKEAIKKQILYTMDRTDKVIIEWYKKGFLDELSGSSSVVPNNTLITKAYIIGANHASMGDDNRSFDYLSDYEILKIIIL